VYASSSDGKRAVAGKQPSKRWDPEASPLPQPGEARAPVKEQQVGAPREAPREAAGILQAGAAGRCPLLLGALPTTCPAPCGGSALTWPPAPQVLLRCVRLSPDGSQLAAGDHKGNLRVYDLRTMALATFKEAHDAEVLTLDYCRWPAAAAAGGLAMELPHCLASRFLEWCPSGCAAAAADRASARCRRCPPLPGWRAAGCCWPAAAATR
jgi:hypothetical protein